MYAPRGALCSSGAADALHNLSRRGQLHSVCHVVQKAQLDAPFRFNMPRARDRGAFGCLSAQSMPMQFNMLFETCGVVDFFVECFLMN